MPDMHLGNAVSDWRLSILEMGGIGWRKDLALKLTTSPFTSRYFFSTSPMTAREDLTSEMARRP